MSDQEPKKPSIPLWAWLFFAVCIAIPVITVGGAIPGAIGGGGAFACIAIARQAQNSTRGRLLRCVAVTASCWVLFLVFLGGIAAIQSKRSVDSSQSHNLSKEMSDTKVSQTKKDPLADEAERRKIYRMAVSTRNHIEFAQAQKASVQAKGFDVSGREEQIERLKQSHEKRLNFLVGFHEITREQLDALIIEGDTKSWQK